LPALGRIDFGQPDTHSFVMHEHRQRVAVRDADHQSLELARMRWERKEKTGSDCCSDKE
jgi:hypothetical protein